MKEKYQTAKEDGARFARNVYEFLEACSLTAVSGWAIYTCRDRANWYETIVLVAGIYIALRAAQLFVRHFNKRTV